MVETAGTADPPADITDFKPDQPDSGELLLRIPIARRTRHAVDWAGSYGSATVAAIAQTDFDIRRNGASIATMRFAAAADPGIFIAAVETVLEPGDVLSVVVPFKPGCEPRRHRIRLDRYDGGLSTNPSTGSIYRKPYSGKLISLPSDEFEALI